MSSASAPEGLSRSGWLAARWAQLVFPAAAPAELGWLRILFYGAVTVFSFSLHGDVARWARVDDVFWAPTFFFRLLDIPVLPATVLSVLLWVWRASLVLAAVGLFTRASTLLALILGFYLIGLPHNFGKINHGDAITVLGLAVFAFARAGDAWSIDRLRQARDADAGGPSGHYSWPLGLYRLLLALVLFGAGVAKLRAPGPLAWVLTDNLHNTLIRHHYTHAPPIDVGLFVARFPWVCHLIAGGALTLELLAPLLCLFSPMPRAAFAGLIIGMMVGFWLTLGVLFAEFLTLLVIFFFPWRIVAERVVGYRPAARLSVLYDGSCGLCRRTVGVIRALDLRGAVEILDVLADWPAISSRWPGLDQRACLDDMHVMLGGRAHTGFHGYQALAWELPLGWPLLPVLYAPGIPGIGTRVYRCVARRRHATGCPVPVERGRSDGVWPDL